MWSQEHRQVSEKLQNRTTEAFWPEDGDSSASSDEEFDSGSMRFGATSELLQLLQLLVPRTSLKFARAL